MKHCSGCLPQCRGPFLHSYDTRGARFLQSPETRTYQPEPEPLSQPEPPPQEEPLEEPLLCEPLPDQLPLEPDPFDEEPEPLQWLPEDQPELPERLIDIVQLPLPQLELPDIWPPLDHVKPLLICQDQPPLRPFHAQRPESHPAGQPYLFQWP